MFIAPPAAMPRLPSLDGLRMVGALAVVGTHVGFMTGTTTGTAWGGWTARLDVGVAIFFVLSGFLLFRPYAYAAAVRQPRPKTGRYLWRRALRILPAYWVAVVACMTLLPANASSSLENWVRHLTLTQIYAPLQLRPGLGQSWSLATEAAFYLALPLFAIFALGRRWRPVRTMLVTTSTLLVTAGWVAAMAMGDISRALPTLWLPAYAAWFGGGMALAAAHVALRTGTAPPRWQVLDTLGAAPLACWAIALALLAVATTPLAGPRFLVEPTAAQFGIKQLLYLGIAVLILISLAFGPATRTKAVFSTAPVRWLGTISYGLFLWHMLVLELIYLLGDRQPFTGGLPSTFAMTLGGGLVLATISYYAVERPFQRWSAAPTRRGGTVVPRPRAGMATESHSATSVASTAS
ncbi:acyltransferase [Micromonospora sp. NPDC049679]|uniref:acyltransferase family protein n=1 Tax=Micromonospora sp. NPDC049679 TaxID=3155920 RepID=UPI00340C8565